ncbi:transcriptional regulator [Caulobacter sp. Root655]|uniref:LysR family transcriptional regulator n=1 Tax=Caulobacter sp. Root655 TaxID=1736578 RepID=UPI0007016A15|nr:LysR family transcriptional regulator [Caulobacter sp. Root655]KRA66290.1 transcriptional regulator [Caulobacter sp. Root655]
MDQRPLPDLAVFALVAQHRSFRAAAQVLGVSASALSHTLRNLETRLDVRLLHRTTRSVAPTEAGERLLARLAPALADIDVALGEIAAYRDRPAGRLRLNLARSAARWLFAPRVGGFLKAYPDVRVEMVCDDGLSDIVAGGFDCGVRLGESLQADMIAVPIGGDLSQALVASPEYLAEHGAPARPEDVPHHRCLLNRRPTGQTWPWEFERQGRVVVVNPPGVLVCDENEVLRRACLDGAGLAFLFRDQVEGDIAAGRLVPLLEDWCEPFAGFFLYYTSRRQLSPALRAFIDWMRD